MPLFGFRGMHGEDFYLNIIYEIYYLFNLTYNYKPMVLASHTSRIHAREMLTCFEFLGQRLEFEAIATHADPAKQENKWGRVIL